MSIDNNASGFENISQIHLDTVLPQLVLQGLDDYLSPSLQAVGCILCILSSIIFSRDATLRRFSSAHYLAAMTAADAGFMGTALIMWLPRIHINFYLEEGFCQLFLSCNYIFNFLSIWFTVAFVTDAYIRVCRPDKAKAMCTVVRSKCAITALTVLAIAMFTHVTWMSGIVNGYCMLLVTIDPELALIDKIQTLVTILLPDLALMALAVLITRKKVYDHCGLRSRSKNADSDSSNGHARSSTNKTYTEKKHGAAATRIRLYPSKSNAAVNSETIVVALSLVLSHIITTLPDHCIKLWFTALQILHGDSGHLPTSYEISLQQLFSHLGQMRFVVQFVIFVIVLSDFQIVVRHLSFAICRSASREPLRQCRKRRPRYGNGRAIEESVAMTAKNGSRPTDGNNLDLADVEV